MKGFIFFKLLMLFLKHFLIQYAHAAFKRLKLNKKDFILKTYETIDFIKENLPLLIIISSANFFILVGLINITENTPVHLSKIPEYFPNFF